MASHNNKRDEQGMKQFSTTASVGRRLVAWITACALLFSTTAPYAAQSITYYHWDAIGSPVAATDEDGNVKWREQYRPYGERIENQAAAQSNSRWYTGHPYDNATGLTYAGARYYDPVVGRFMGIDPQAFRENEPNLFNRFAYANNNPYKYIDPDGELPILVIGLALYAGYELLTHSNYANAPTPGGATFTQSTADHIEVVVGATPMGKIGSTGKVVWHAVDSNKGSQKINWGKQAKHFPGHNNYTPGRSVLTADPRKLAEKAGTGQHIDGPPVGSPGSKERVDFGEPIGEYVDKSGKAVSTSKGLIHYGKEGIHIVPARP